MAVCSLSQLEDPSDGSLRTNSKEHVMDANQWNER